MVDDWDRKEVDRIGKTYFISMHINFYARQLNQYVRDKTDSFTYFAVYQNANEDRKTDRSFSY